MLLAPREIFEVRLKRREDRGAAQMWLTREKAEIFAKTHIPIHESHKRHIWVGVCPRRKVGDSTPLHGRVLWADLASSVDTLEGAKRALAATSLPLPTMTVWSGNGVHLYWRLDREVSPEELRKYSRGVHAALPTDATHDPTRVMRVPGTKNFKDPNNPKDCVIVEYEPDRVYSLDRFPALEPHYQDLRVPGARPKQMTPILQQDFDAMVAAFLEGQRHNLAVGIAGYLRKNLYYDEQSCVEELGRIAKAAGYEMDDNLRRVVSDTYKAPFAKVSGIARLREFGIEPRVKDVFHFEFRAPPKPKISIIDFTQDIPEQEFWMDGLVGPGLLTLWAAEPKTGKSFAVMQIGHALAWGLDLWDFKVHGKHRVLYFQGELSRGMVYSRARSMFGPSAIRNPKQFAMTDKPSQVLSLVEHPEVLTDLAENYDVVIVDPISAFNSNDENAAHSVRDTLAVFDPLKAAGKAVILVHHTKKLQTNRDGTTVVPSFSDIRGSSAWFAAVDAAAIQHRLKDTPNTRVKFMFRAAPERDPLDLYRLPNGSFTHDRTLYLASMGNTFRADISLAMN
jgi:hypothetical protein